ncbi:hypothetical protein F5884DRAFT_522137 [Xylogone sp. PMI_703]|nr:hypothetical protein F5884DRAFT_522137 [Xylogone sp. PMI_703]
MAVIWGLDLHEMQWGKFKGSYMFNNVYHLRRMKMIVYQIAMILCVVSESVGTAALTNYVDQQTDVYKLSGGRATVHNDDFIGIASYNIFVGIAVATIFGAAFFFDLFWPERHESKSVRLAWKICSVVVSFMALASALGLTVIVASHSAYITGVPSTEAEQLRAAIPSPPFRYRKNAKCIVSTVILWPGVVASFASAYILWTSHFHDEQFGPFSDEHNRRTKEEQARNVDPVGNKVDNAV